MSGSIVAALVSLRVPYHHFPTSNGNISLLLFCLVFLVLAYVTNPAESSFRAFLTELSFRHHLSRLDDSLDRKKSSKQSSSSGSSLSANGSANKASTAPFHFTNRASISLRTPKHVFHSFGFFTLAAIVPLTRAEREALNASLDRDGSLISDSWFIGAFGKWWRGGIIEAWYQDVVTRPSEEEGWSSGILGMKTLDRLNGYHGLPFAHKNPSLLKPAKGSAPRLRNRERPAQRNSVPAVRSSTPPPLPKSASLPLHTPRNAPSAPERPAVSPSPQTSPGNGHLPPLPLEQSPRIAELHQQITAAKSSVSELRVQFVDVQTSASESHAALQSELDSVRERRRQEDSAKSELKTRTKALDDSKRLAEGSKRDAEKRLKAAQTARDDATHRIQRLDTEIAGLQQSMELNQQATQDSVAEMEQTTLDLHQSLEHKKKEFKVAEEVVAALSLRAKELEERITTAKERLTLLQERNQDPIVHSKAQTGPWSQVYFQSGEPAASQPIGFFDLNTSASAGTTVSESDDSHARPTRLSLGSISNFHPSQPATGLTQLRSNGYPAFPQSFVPGSTTSSNFTVFDDDSFRIPLTPGSGPLSPTGRSLIPSGLMSSLDIAETLQNPSNPSLKSTSPGWNHGRSFEELAAPMASPSSFSPADDHDPFEVRMPPAEDRRRMKSGPSPDSSGLQLSRSRSIPSVNEGSEPEVPMSGPRQWFATISRPKVRKGLNPDAKEFSFVPHSPPSSVIQVPAETYDALNPHGILTSSTAPTTSSSLLRAFAPSPAEREALQRALGSSTNTSLERLPSLSDVGSIPSSPAHAHAQATPVGLPSEPPTGREFTKSLSSWLQLPKARKTTFSPWADEDPTPTAETRESRAPW